MEELVWLVIPHIFLGATSWLFWLTTKIKKVWPFVGVAVVSIIGFLFVRPTCCCIGIDQIFGALSLAIPFNVATFLIGFIVAFILVKVKIEHRIG